MCLLIISCRIFSGNEWMLLGNQKTNLTFPSAEWSIENACAVRTYTIKVLIEALGIRFVASPLSISIHSFSFWTFPNFHPFWQSYMFNSKHFFSSFLHCYQLNVSFARLRNQSQGESRFTAFLFRHHKFNTSEVSSISLTVKFLFFFSEFEFLNSSWCLY